MTNNCNVIRDLLPLYADDVCSDESRRLIEAHLPKCPECASMLEQLRSQEIEKDLQEEKTQIIRYQAKRFRRRSAAVGSVFAGLFMIPVLVCLIVAVSSGAAMGWFFIVLGALAVAASLIIVPLMAEKNKLLLTFCAFCVSLLLLLAICAAVSRGGWFLTAASASLFGLSVVFLPFVLRAEPVRNLIGGFSRPLIAVAADTILFANMMNMISLNTKSAFVTVLMALGCAGGAALLIFAIQTKRGETK